MWLSSGSDVRVEQALAAMAAMAGSPFLPPSPNPWFAFKLPSFHESTDHKAQLAILRI
jgi:hypothetical protein